MMKLPVTLSTQQMVLISAIGVIGLLITDPALAGTGGTAFDAVWNTLKDWTQGTLGRIIAGAMVIVGLVAGIARQSLMGFALGVGGGMGLYNTPTVIESVMSATLPLVAPGQTVWNIAIPAIEAVVSGL